MADAEDTTDDNGGFSFRGLRAGTYSVEISGFDSNEVSFSSTSGAATVGVGESKVVSFDGTYLRTAGVMGQVTFDGGEGLGGVTVTLLGEGEDRTETTNASGNYAFSQLKGGSYQVAISGYDTDNYEFEVTSKSVTIATGETANVPFEGTLLRTAGISGRVSLDDGMGIDGVTVTLAGAAEATRETASGGLYSFAGLAAGTYVVSISNPDPVAYNFADDQLQRTVVLEDAQAAIENFEGTHTRTASISGMLFIDEVMQDKMRNDGEPSITDAIAPLVAAGALDAEVVAGLLAKAKVMLRGPDLNTVVPIDIMADGSFSTGAALMAGTYHVTLPVNDDDVAAGLAAAGVAFVGESPVVTVEAGGSATANFPFRITMQTVSVGAVMGNREMITDPPRPVAGVELELYPTAEDAEDGTNMLGTGGETNEMGIAVFSFARDDDSSPAGDATDNLVFVRVADPGNGDLSVSDNPIIEIEYPGVARVHAAPTHVRLLNTMVRFQFWVKSDKDARSGDMPLAGWHTQVYMGDPTADDAAPLMKADPEDETKMVNLADPTESGKGDDGGELGRAMVSYKVAADDLPAVFTVMVQEDSDDWAQPMAMGETWEEVGENRLMHTHTGFELPAANTHKANDLMATYVTFKTQKLTVGAYREADDEPGFTDFQSRVADGDHRPAAGVGLSVSVMVDADGRRGLEVYDKWDHDGKAITEPIEATLSLTGGMATFANLPADMDFTVQFDEGSNRVAVGGPDSRSDRVQAFGADLELGKSVGAFGDASGAGPEVTLCPLTTDMRPSSLGDMDSDCATFAYQWTTGSITGGLNKAVKDLDVAIEADTDVHSEAPRDTETDKDGEFGFSGIQDGVYTVTMASSADYKVVPAGGRRVAIYHDEFTDDKDPDTKYVGTAEEGTAAFSATRLRLSIKGYAANISHENNQVVRDDETYEGAILELYAYDATSKADIKKKGPVVGTATVGADGLYEFNDLDEGNYTIVAKNTDDYEMLLEAGVHYKNNVAAHTYGSVGEQLLKLPLWDYAASKVPDDPDEEPYGDRRTSTHTVGTGASALTFTFHNFALLHGDGDFSGRVIEARGDPAGIAVELRRCVTYTAADPDAATPVEETCREEIDFDAQTRNASGSTGRWDFDSLREGWYVVNIAATTYNRAKWGANGIDDDATNCEGTATAGTDSDPLDPTDPNCDTVRTDEVYGMLEGKRAFNRGGATFYVYNDRLDSESAATEVVVKGTSDIDAGKTTLATLTSGIADGELGTTDVLSSSITWASGSITITPDIPDNATFTAKVMDGTKLVSRASGETGDEVTLALIGDKTSATTGAVDGTANVSTVEVTVTAENGYNDDNFSFGVSRADPVDARLTDLTFGLTRTATDGATGFTFTATDDEQTATVLAGSGTGSTMSLFIRVTGKALQEGIEVNHNGTVLDALSPQSNQGALVHDYRITIPKTGSLQGHVVNITVTSEDGVDFNYEISLER